MQIDIYGTIGVGKSTLLKNLPNTLHKVEEPVESNPWLKSFYAELAYCSELKKAGVSHFPTRTTPMMEVYLQASRKYELGKYSKNDIVISDWGLPAVFARMLMENGIISKLDYETFLAVKRVTLSPPDIVLFLKGAEFAYNNMLKRGRECEKCIDMEYLQAIEASYEQEILDYCTGTVVHVLHWPKDYSKAVDIVKNLVR